MPLYFAPLVESKEDYVGKRVPEGSFPLLRLLESAVLCEGPRVPSGATALTTEDPRNFKPTKREFDIFQGLLGVRPEGETLFDCLYDLMGAKSAPDGDGINAIATRTPHADLKHGVFLTEARQGNQQQGYGWLEPPHKINRRDVAWKRVQDAVAKKITKVAERDPELAGKMQGMNQLKYRLKPGEEKMFLERGVDIQTRKPATRFFDNFNGSNSTNITAHATALNWEEIPTSSFEINNNKLQSETVDLALRSARANDDLSSDDMRVTADVQWLNANSSVAALLARYTSTAATQTYVRGGATRIGASYFIQTVNGGSAATLAIPSAVITSSEVQMQLTVDGSVAYLSIAQGTALYLASDHGNFAPGNTRHGVSQTNNAQDVTFDNYVAEDWVTAVHRARPRYYGFT